MYQRPSFLLTTFADTWFAIYFSSTNLSDFFSCSNELVSSNSPFNSVICFFSSSFSSSNFVTFLALDLKFKISENPPVKNCTPLLTPFSNVDDTVNIMF